MTDKWYIIQTRPRWEKKVADSLEQKGIESYCPVKKVKRKWSDRIKTLEQPLFKSCIFVRISPQQKTEVRLLEGVVNFIYQNGKPVQVKERQVKMFKEVFNGDVRAEGLLNSDISGELGKSHKTFQVNLDSFAHWIKVCMERPRLV